MSLASRSRTTTRVFAAAVAIAPLAAMSGACTSTTTTLPYTPITGIVILSRSLVAGYGCGTADAGPDEIYRYAAVLTSAPPDGGTDASASQLPLTNIFDCFADGVFENLQGSTFDLKIYAYKKASYDAAALPLSLGCTPGQSSDASCTPAAQALTPSQEAAADWTTTCYATQQSGAPVLATCGPLEGAGATGAVDASSGTSTDAAGAADAIGDAQAQFESSTDAASGGDADSAAAGDAAGTMPADANSTTNDGAADGG
ncbi:MAG TPA: hypothetical protein VII82_00710 [Polyangiaceae bacterium]